MVMFDDIGYDKIVFVFYTYICIYIYADYLYIYTSVCVMVLYVIVSMFKCFLIYVMKIDDAIRLLVFDDADN
jgi:hypothetical protein